MVVYPRDWATLAIDTAARPSASAMPIAASTMRSMLISRFGPRCGFAATPQASATARGSSGSAGVSGVMGLQSAGGACVKHRTVYYLNSCAWHKQFNSYTGKAQPMTLAIDARGIAKRFRSTTVLDDL